MIAVVMPFGSLLRAAIKRRGLSQLAFAKAVGAGSSTITQVADGKRTAPLDRMNAWADALGLTGPARQAFLEAAYLTHAPEQVRHLVAQLRRELDEQGRMIAELQESVARITSRRAAEERH